MFKHYLVTRFNVRIAGMGPEIIESPPLDEEWMKTRLQFFTPYCAKSVCAQTNANFIWLVYFDEHTGPEVFQSLEVIKSCGKQIEFVRVRDFDHMLEDLRDWISKQSQPYVITSRLDNDDLISPDFIDRVQHAFEPGPLTLINFNAGYEYDVNRDMLKKWNQRLHNQFISLVEHKRDTNALTVYGFPHWGPPADAKVINIDHPAAWMHLRHVNNYSPNTFKAIPVFSMTAANHFPIQPRKRLKAWWNTLHYAVQWFPRMLWRRISTAA